MHLCIFFCLIFYKYFAALLLFIGYGKCILTKDLQIYAFAPVFGTERNEICQPMLMVVSKGAEHRKICSSRYL
jgi:hypothetical protein